MISIETIEFNESTIELNRFNYTQLYYPFFETREDAREKFIPFSLVKQWQRPTHEPAHTHALTPVMPCPVQSSLPVLLFSSSTVLLMSFPVFFRFFFLAGCDDNWVFSCGIGYLGSEREREREWTDGQIGG